MWRLPLTIPALSSCAKNCGSALRFSSGNPPPVTVYKSLPFQSFAAPMQNSTGCTGLNGISIRSLFPPPQPLFQQFTRELLALPLLFLFTSFYFFFPFYFFAAFQLFPHSSLEITNKRKTLIDVPLMHTKLYCAYSHLETPSDRCSISR